MGAYRPWPYPCDRSHGCHYFQRSHNSLALKQVLSFSENNGSHKRALIDRKGMARVFLDYGSTGIKFVWVLWGCSGVLPYMFYAAILHEILRFAVLSQDDRVGCHAERSRVISVVYCLSSFALQCCRAVYPLRAVDSSARNLQGSRQSRQRYPAHCQWLGQPCH